jgi:P-type Cu+ transporter
VVGLVLLVVVVGEWLGAFEQLTDRVPYLVGLALVLAGGSPIFANVARAALGPPRHLAHPDDRRCDRGAGGG